MSSTRYTIKLPGGILETSVTWVLTALLLSILPSFLAAAQAAPRAPSKQSATVLARAEKDPQKVFVTGETALREGKLDDAERSFRQVLEIDPGVAGAYANLGVIQMRRKHWPLALAMLRKAEKLAPTVVGIRLNIGLVYFRQNDFASAIAPFESVVKQQPDSYQAKHLLGLCYFFNGRWADAVAALEPLWGQASDQLNYLYVLGRAAEKTNNTPLEEKAYGRLAEIGQNTPEFHLIMGKAHMNRGEYEEAVNELMLAIRGNTNLPFAHFNLGLVYVRKQEYEHARSELLQDLKVDPDAPFTYEQLGNVEISLEKYEEAEKSYRQAVKLNPQLPGAHMGLAKIEERRREYALALADLDMILHLDKDNAAARYLRGQVLLHMGREKEGRAELAAATRLLNQQRAARQEELERPEAPSPELAREP